MPATPSPVVVDLSDFDAVAVLADVVVAVRSAAIEGDVDVAATVSAPQGWHRVVLSCSRTGNLALRVRLTDLTVSRANNVQRALVDRRWVLDEDGDGIAVRQPPGTEATSVAFEVLSVLSVGGAPADVRTVMAVDHHGAPVPLSRD